MSRQGWKVRRGRRRCRCVYSAGSQVSSCPHCLYALARHAYLHRNPVAGSPSSELQFPLPLPLSVHARAKRGSRGVRPRRKRGSIASLPLASVRELLALLTPQFRQLDACSTGCVRCSLICTEPVSGSAFCQQHWLTPAQLRELDTCSMVVCDVT